jgi:hypothetical protein
MSAGGHPAGGHPASSMAASGVFSSEQIAAHVFNPQTVTHGPQYGPGIHLVHTSWKMEEEPRLLQDTIDDNCDLEILYPQR